MKTIKKIRDNSSLVSSFSLFLFLVSLLAVSLLLGRVFIDDHPLDRFLVTIFYFTTQSNVIIFLIMIFYLLKKTNKSWFKILAFIGLIDIVITGLFFHLFLASYMDSVGFMQQVLHTVVPLLYILFYFIIIEDAFKIKDIWISLIHPVIYVISIYTWIHPLFGQLISRVMVDLPGASYVYPFLDPATYEHSIVGLILFNFGILTPTILVISFLLIYMKSRLEMVLKNGQ